MEEKDIPTSAKKKFSPKINRIILNPEQIVLACACYTDGHKKMSAYHGHLPLSGVMYCYAGKMKNRGDCHTDPYPPMPWLHGMNHAGAAVVS